MSQPPHEPTPPLDPYAKPAVSDQQATTAIPSPYQAAAPAGYPPAGYGAPPAAPGFSYPEASQATLVLILGILSVVAFSLLGPFAWWLGLKEKRGIDAGRRDPANRGQAVAGYVLGIVGTVLLGIGVLVAIGYVIFFVLLFGGAIASSSSDLGAALQTMTV